MATGPNEVDEIYQRMELIRRDRHARVSESVAGAEAVVDWGRYTWMYPWIALGTAAAVGYLVYTRGHKQRKVTSAAGGLAEAAEARLPFAGVVAGAHERSRAGPNLLLAAWGILYPVAVRAGQNYALHWIERHFPTKTAD